MTDRELLELAAKAAGIDLQWRKFVGLGDLPAPDYVAIDKETGLGWNPLARDGDAFRLAVELELDVMCASVRCAELQIVITIQAGVDKFAATRHAIVLAAAEIGKTIQ